MRRLSTHDRAKILREQVAHPPAGESPLHCFVRHTWHLVEPRPFIDGRHLHALSEAFTYVHSGDIKQLVLNITPASGKSKMANVFWPAFIWCEVDPSLGMLFASYDQELVNRDARLFLDLLNSPLIQAAYPDLSVPGDQAVRHFYNSQRGERFGTSCPGGKLTGRHFGGHVYDDLVKPAAILPNVPGAQQTALKEAERWIKQTAGSRTFDHEALWRMMIAQRLHEADPPGAMLEDGDWEHLCLPEEYVPNATWIIGDLTKRLEWRKEPNELIWPEHRTEKAVKKLKKKMDSQAEVDAQLQQNPSSDAAGVIDRTKLHYYDNPPKLSNCRVIVSCDLSFGKEQVENSRCAWTVWAMDRDQFIYFIAGQADWMSYSKAKAKTRALRSELGFSSASAWLVEDKANGTALMDELKGEMGMIAVTPGAVNKIERMLPHVDAVHSGRVLWPKGKWADPIITEICKVPRGTLDDYFDTMSQALSYLRFNATNAKQALESWRKNKAKLQSLF